MLIKDFVNSRTTNYAKNELSCYLEKIAGKDNNAEITLGLLADDYVKDTLIDDAYEIDIKDGKGSILGSNERSILLGIYDYLKSLGCRFLRPGEDGEIIPEKELSGHSYKTEKKAFYPYRVECLEGSINSDIVIKTIKWLPKVGYNSFYIQGIVPFNFFDRWYDHIKNPFKESENLTYEQAIEETAKIEDAIKLVGLQFHDVGHAYTFEPFGIHYLTSWRHKYTIDEQTRPFVALVKGKRDVMHRSINFTNLCYSNPEARRKIVDFFVDYMKKKPTVDLLYVWLADAVDNQCECDECKKTTVSDSYVKLLNELDEAFSKNNITSKIMTAQYTDTRFAPRTERFKNPERFLLMPAINTKFFEPYSTEEYTGEVPEYKLNEFVSLDGFKPFMKVFEGWKNMADIPSVFFDYDLYSTHYCDPGYMRAARLLGSKVKMLKEFGAIGLINCKTQRCFFPTSLPAYACGELLFDPDKDFEDIAKEYFEASFGTLAEQAYSYLNRISEIFDPEFLKAKVTVEMGEDTNITTKKPNWKDNKKAAENFSLIAPLVDSFVEKAKEHLKTEKNGTVRRSITLLFWHAEMVKMFAEALTLGANGDEQASKTKAAELLEFAAKNEDEFLQEFDLVLFTNRINAIFK